jgi:hypothetical protein
MSLTVSATGMKDVQTGDFDRIRSLKDRLRQTVHRTAIPYWPDLDLVWMVDLPGDEVRVLGFHEFTQRRQADDPLRRPFVPQEYLEAALYEYTQGKYARTTRLCLHLGRLADCDACVVVFNEDATQLAVYNLSRRSGWERMTFSAYINRINRLMNRLAPHRVAPCYPHGTSSTHHPRAMSSASTGPGWCT